MPPHREYEPRNCPCGIPLTRRQLAANGKYHSLSCARKHRPIRSGPFIPSGGPESGIRVCLNCDKPFFSEGPWNRICPYCSADPERDRIPPSWPLRGPSGRN